MQLHIKRNVIVSLDEWLAGLTVLNPPRRAGRAKSSRSRSLGGALPVQAGIS